MLKNLVRAGQLTIPVLEELFVLADDMRKKFVNPQERKQLHSLLAGRLMHTIFYEKSMLTRSAFNSAALHLGMGVDSTELTKDAMWETLEDFLRFHAGCGPDVIVLRHPHEGASERALAIVEAHGYPCHIINAGDGRKQHPSQALVDVYTIHRHFGCIDGLTVVIGGDLTNGRSVRSLVQILAQYPRVRIIFVSPEQLRIGTDVIEYLIERHITFEQVQDMGSVLPHADVVYWMRLQLELITNSTLAHELHELQQREFTIRVGHLGLLKPNSIILHPLPRSGEISPHVDADPRAHYFVQAQNGLFIRMALLMTLVRGAQP